MRVTQKLTKAEHQGTDSDCAPEVVVLKYSVIRGLFPSLTPISPSAMAIHGNWPLATGSPGGGSPGKSAITVKFPSSSLLVETIVPPSKVTENFRSSSSLCGTSI